MLDLENKLLRHVSEAFVEDPLRVFRVCRFNSTLNFDIHPDTLNLMKQVVNSGEIRHLSQERIWNEIVSGLKGGNPSKMIDSLRTCGALREMSDMLLLGTEDIKDRKLIYRALDLASKNQLAIESRVAIFCLLTEKNLTKVLTGNTQPAPNFHVIRLKAVLNKLKVTKTQHQVSLRFLTHLRSVLSAYQMRNEQLVDLIINLDGLRNPLRFGHILESISIVDEVFTNGAHSGQLGLVKDSLKVLKSTKHGDLKLTQDRENMRKVIRLQRIAALDDAFPSRRQFDETVVSEPNE
jgi:tRNA nucleotidyltransferase (CCA-adding enzyme)